MRSPHSTSDDDCEAVDALPAKVCDQANVVRQNVDAVVVLEADGNLELARQIRSTVDRFAFLRLVGLAALAVDPDLMVGARPWRKLSGDARSEGLRFGMRA